MGRERWYEGGGDMEIGGGYESSGGGGAWQDSGSTQDTLEAGNQLLQNQPSTNGSGGEQEPAPSGGGGGASSVAEAAWRAHGSPPTGDVQAWYDNAVKAGAIDTRNTFRSNADILAGTGASGYNAGDVTAYRNIDPKIVQGMTPEQRAAWSMENIDSLDHMTRQQATHTWLIWQKSYDPNCPVASPYQAEDGSGCVEKPPNSNRGGPGGGGGGGGGGRGGGRGGSGGGGGPSGVQPRADYNLQSNYLTQRGVGTGYGPGSAIGTPATAPVQPAAAAAQAAPAVANPAEFQLNQQQQQIAPGAQTIPTLQNGALWSTGW